MQPRKKWRPKRYQVILLIVGGLMVGYAILVLILNYLATRVLHQWKTETIAHIQRWSADPAWLQREQEWLDGHGPGNGGELLMEHALSNRMIQMASGEWVIYRLRVNEQWPFGDYFIGKGSDGVWYYSGNHFCFGMMAYQMQVDFQMPDLKTFIRLFNLVPFDGQSDACLHPGRTNTDPADIDKVRPPAAVPQS